MSDVLAPLAAIRAPDMATATTRAASFLAMVESWEVVDDQTFELAGDELRAIKSQMKSLEEQRTAMTVPLNGVLKSINALFKPPQEALEKGERIIKAKMVAYTEVVERARREADRLAAEAARAAEVVATAQGHTAQDDVAEAAVMAAAAEPALAITAPKAAGVTKVRETVKARVIDKAAFLRAVVANPQYLHLVEVDQSAINALAKALGQSLKIDGVETYVEKSISARSF